jgi:hypothetical protein
MPNYYDEIFYPGAFTDTEKLELIKSDFWTGALAIHLAMDKATVVLRFLPDKGRVIFGTKNGVPAAILWFHTSKRQYVLSQTNGAFSFDPYYKPMVKSANIRYIASSLRKSESDSRAEFTGQLEYRSRGYADMLNVMYSTFTARYPQDREIPMLMRGSLQKLLLRHYFGKTQSTEFPQVIQEQLDSYMTQYERKDATNAANLDMAQDLFGGDRWLLLHAETGLWMIGIDCSALVSQYKDGKSSNVQLPYTYQGHYVPYEAAIPEDVRPDLMAKLTMLKLFRERSLPLGTKQPSWDAGGLIPITSVTDGQFLTEAGSLLRYYDGKSMILLPK